MKSVFAAMLLCLLLAGCVETPPQQQDNQTGVMDEVTANVSEAEEPEEEEQPVAGGEGTILEVPSGDEEEEPAAQAGIPATSQQDCATLTPNCKTCVSKPGCGWCKSSNSCFLGTASGPSVSSCPPSEWTVTESGCSVVDEDESCSDITNCAACLSGTGCRWCIQGSKCASASSAEDCFGGWLTESYQCNYASR